MLEDDVVDDVS